MNTWQPIETAPKDGTEIITGFDSATVWICHVAWWKSWEDWMELMPEAHSKDECGWWSYTENSVGQTFLDNKPTHWIELPDYTNITK
mgnify:CR=1 FL=1